MLRIQSKKVGGRYLTDCFRRWKVGNNQILIDYLCTNRESVEQKIETDTILLLHTVHFTAYLKKGII